jgi:lipid-A-disaccharide synthase
VALRVLVSAGEASGDRYAARLVEALRRRFPDASFFGCAGPEMRRAGVEPIIESESISVIGLLEVVSHIPRIYGEYRKLLAAARDRKPDFAILTDSPDFHLRVAKRLKSAGVPVFYLVAPQAWAWRSGRIATLQRNVNQLHCIFPFEEAFFRRNGVPATYIGHPLANSIQTHSTREALGRRFSLDPGRPWIALCPGSRSGEIERHLPVLSDAVRRLESRGALFLLALPEGTEARMGAQKLGNLIAGAPVHIIEGATWDVMGHSELVLAASGTVTMEAALLGRPMITFYKVTPFTWHLGRRLVNVPYYSMVNLIAERKIVPELMQDDCTGASLAVEAGRLLDDSGARETMLAGLAEVKRKLTSDVDPLDRSTDLIAGWLERNK